MTASFEEKFSHCEFFLFQIPQKENLPERRVYVFVWLVY